MDKYKVLDDSIENFRYNFFLGVSGGSKICGTCEHYETILNDSGSVTDTGHCYSRCKAKTKGSNKTHAETNIQSLIDSGIKVEYVEYNVRDIEN
jgi:hypothetical protein